jgi:hypothetical protein
MIPQTVPLNEAPDMLGAFDRIVERARSQNAANAAYEVERAAEVALLAEAFEDGMTDDVRAPALFARRRANPNQAPSVADCLFDAIDTDSLRIAFAELVMDSALGLPVAEKAAALIQQAAKRWAENEVA